MYVKSNIRVMTTLGCIPLKASLLGGSRLVGLYARQGQWAEDQLGSNLLKSLLFDISC